MGDLAKAMQRRLDNSDYAKALGIFYSTERPLTMKEVLILQDLSKQAADILVKMGPVFKTAFLEANRVYLSVSDIAKARGYNEGY